MVSKSHVHRVVTDLNANTSLCAIKRYRPHRSPENRCESNRPYCRRNTDYIHNVIACIRFLLSVKLIDVYREHFSNQHQLNILRIPNIPKAATGTASSEI